MVSYISGRKTHVCGEALPAATADSKVGETCNVLFFGRVIILWSQYSSLNKIHSFEKEEQDPSTATTILLPRPRMDHLLERVSRAIDDQEFASLGHALDQAEIEVGPNFVVVQIATLCAYNHKKKS